MCLQAVIFAYIIAWLYICFHAIWVALLNKIKQLHKLDKKRVCSCNCIAHASMFSFIPFFMLPQSTLLLASSLLHLIDVLA